MITKLIWLTSSNAAQADDQVRLQPVLAMALFKKHLQAAQPDAQRDDAGVVGALE
jgi:hypothetical protein